MYWAALVGIIHWANGAILAIFDVHACLVYILCRYHKPYVPMNAQGRMCAQG